MSPYFHEARNGLPAQGEITCSARSPREEYFERVGDMRDRSEEERQAFFEKHDNYWV